MQSVFKTILGILIMVMILFSGLGILWANNEAVAAESYIQRVADEVSSANLRTDVLDAEVDQAKKDGYTLSYDVMDDNHGVRHYVVLKLHYQYKVSVAALSGTHEKTMTVY